MLGGIFWAGFEVNVMIKHKLVAMLVSVLCGVLFGAGLLVSDMANPNTVQGFLDIAGDWNASLAFVMLGALSVTSLGFAVSQRRTVSLLGEEFPSIRRGITWRLVCGALIFGMGWGILGICPAPAIVLMGQGVWQAVVFFVTMLTAMAGVIWWDKRSM